MAYKVLEETNVPMSADEIWRYAVENEIDQLSNLRGKTPSRTIQAQLYTDIAKGNSRFIQTGKNPPTFFISGKVPSMVEQEQRPESRKNERNLHPFLVNYVRYDSHFRCWCKTIKQETSTKHGKNSRVWVHPDIIGVYFPYEEFDNTTRALLDTLDQNMIRIYSFELKWELNLGNVRQSFFQALSNSGWANEGYLVATKIDNDAIEELRGLSESFGIGVIRLYLEDPSQSEILFPSRTRDGLDQMMLDRLVSENKDVMDLITSIIEISKIEKVLPDRFDPVQDSELLAPVLKIGGDHGKKSCQERNDP